MKIEIDSIRVPRGRRALGDYAELARSISLLGLLQPITVAKDHTLIAGNHRLNACRSLGWKKIDANVVDFDKIDRLLAEIDENLLHNPLKALERAEQTAKRKELYLAKNPETKQGTAGGKAKAKGAKETISFVDDTAKKTDKSAKSVQQDVKIATDIIEPVRNQAKGTSLEDSKVALLELSRVPAELQASVAERLISKKAKNVKQAVRQLEEEKRAAAPKPKRADAAIILGSAPDLLPNLAKRPACVVTDPPYGIETHNTRRGGQDYADGEDYALKLLNETCSKLALVCEPGAHLYFFSGYTYAQAFKQVIARHFEIQDNPIIWVKENHTMCDFAQWYPNKHEYIWFAKKPGGDRKLAKCIPDVITVKRERESTHSAEKPTELLRLLIENSTAPGEMVVDPFAGSGSTGVAALELKRHFVGIELDEKWAEVARARIANV